LKTLFFLSLFLLVTNFSQGEEKKQVISPTAENQRSKQPCPLCKLPGRAALFAGGVTKCPPNCRNLCCDGTSVVLVLRGVIDPSGASRITTALSALEGVLPQSTFSDSGHVRIRYAPEKITKAKLRNIIRGCGFEITGEQKTFAVEGLNTRALADNVEAAIRKEPGVTTIETVCPASQKAIVVFDPLQTSVQKIAAAINSTSCRVISP